MTAACALERDGFALVRGVVSAGLIARTIAAFATADVSRSKRSEETYGARNILDVAEVRELASLDTVRAFVSDALDGEPLVVRGIFFDKTPAANWPVAWHQDLSLALAARQETDGWQAWSVKAAVVHVQPPADVLGRMVTLRFHLDACSEDNGPLRVVPGSHAHGRLDRERQASLRAQVNEQSLCVAAGDVIAMRPLIMHASSAARSPHHRRIVHLEFAPRDLLPPGLAWNASSFAL
ncbi:MAG TPA: phytanoyl-CoA dioxygenase family protein [Rhizomicrobium sp.]|jgi:ectoine hydroxylase-related dioxygenase (phytanoyl-CoA dioxygenase family)